MSRAVFRALSFLCETLLPPMREILHLTKDDARRMPWKNGGGVTEELALWPQEADVARNDFEWRISRASVERSGPFSSFVGCERVLVVVSGDGLELSHDAAPRARLHPLEPYAFSGDWNTTARVIGARVEDFGVIVRRDRWRAGVEVLRLGARRVLEELPPGDAFVHVLHGNLVARVSDEDEPFELDERASLWIHEITRPAEIELQGRSPHTDVVLVRFAR